MSAIPLILKIVSTNCNPSLLYGLEACPVTNRQVQSLSYPFNSVYMKLFKSFNANVIKQVQYFSGYLPLSFLLDLRKVVFYYDLLYFDQSPASTLFKWFRGEDMSRLLALYAIPAGAPRGSLKGYFIRNLATECEALG